MMKKAILISIVWTAIALTSASAHADALHGFCTNVTCNDNGAITPVPTNNPSFGFWDAGGPATGTDIIVVLSLTNLGSSIALNPTNVAGSPATSATLLGTQWTSGFLDTFLGLGAQPNNPFNNYGGATGLDPGATGFFVYELNLGTQTVQAQANDLNGPLFSANNLPLGTFILDFVDPPGIGTANSAALQVVPEPGTLALLVAGLLGLAGLARRKINA
jgi:hypothetical protein